MTMEDTVESIQNGVVHIDDTDFILSTLWLRTNPNGEYFVWKGMYDFCQIKFDAVSYTHLIDGISLTVVAVTDTGFTVSIIPHTQDETTLVKKKIGDVVNLENDVIAKYVEKLMRPVAPVEPKGGLTLDFLLANGF